MNQLIFGRPIVRLFPPLSAVTSIVSCAVTTYYIYTRNLNMVRSRHTCKSQDKLADMYMEISNIWNLTITPTDRQDPRD